jgi:hypothetical protein
VYYTAYALPGFIPGLSMYKEQATYFPREEVVKKLVISAGVLHVTGEVALLHALNFKYNPNAVGCPLKLLIVANSLGTHIPFEILKA